MKTPNAPASMKSRTSTESHKYQKLPYGEFFCATTVPMLSPFTGKVDTNGCEWPKGENSKLSSAANCSPSVRSLSLTDISPINGGAFWHSTTSVYSAVPLRGAIVSMGLRGVQGGLRGEIEIFPGPPAKRLYSNSQLFVYGNPSVTACAVPAPRKREPYVIPVSLTSSARSRQARRRPRRS